MDWTLKNKRLFKYCNTKLSQHAAVAKFEHVSVHLVHTDDIVFVLHTLYIFETLYI